MKKIKRENNKQDHLNEKQNQIENIKQNQIGNENEIKNLFVLEKLFGDNNKEEIK